MTSKLKFDSPCVIFSTWKLSFSTIFEQLNFVSSCFCENLVHNGFAQFLWVYHQRTSLVAELAEQLNLKVRHVPSLMYQSLRNNEIGNITFDANVQCISTQFLKECVLLSQIGAQQVQTPVKTRAHLKELKAVKKERARNYSSFLTQGFWHRSLAQLK